MRPFALAALLCALATQSPGQGLVLIGNPAQSPFVSGNESSTSVDVFLDPEAGPSRGGLLGGSNPDRSDRRQFRRARMGVGSVELRERLDYPCHVVVGHKSLTATSHSAIESVWADCSNDPANADGNGNGTVATLVGQNVVATSAQVCMNNGRVKGVALTGLPAACLSGRSTDCPAEVVYAEQTNCGGINSPDTGGPSNWDTGVSNCQGFPGPGDGSLRGAMVGLRLYTEQSAGGGRRFVVGVRALCKAVQPL